MLKILVKRKAEVSQEYIIPPEKKSITIGSELNNDLIIDDKKVSMNHAEIQREDAGYFITDLRSAFGTHLNGELIKEQVKIQPGDTIQIGQHTLLFQEEHGSDEESSLSASATSLLENEDDLLGPITKKDLFAEENQFENVRATSLGIGSGAPEVTEQTSQSMNPVLEKSAGALSTKNVGRKTNHYLLSVYGPYAGKKFQLNNTETKIGRDTKLNDIIIRHDKHGNMDPSISRRHATVFYQDSQYFVSDKRSKTRTFVNQNKVSENDRLPLYTGDEIEIVSDQQSSIFRLCAENDWDFSPPKKSGVWWVRFRWPIIRGISAVLLVVAILMLAQAFNHRSIMTQRAGSLTFEESIWFKASPKTNQLDFADMDFPDNFINVPALGDLDGDGYVDVVFADRQGRIRAISGENRIPLWELPPHIRAQMPGQLVLADINGDGMSDVILLTVTERLLAIDGKLGVEIWNSEILGGSFSGAPVVADVNNDLRADVAVCTEDGRFIIGLGTTTEPVWITFETGDTIRATPSAGDITGDGVDEFLVGTESGVILAFQGKIKKIITKINVNNHIKEILGAGIEQNQIRCPVNIGRLNNDKRPDLVISTSQGNLITIDGKTKRYFWLDSSTPEGDLITHLFFPTAVGELDGNPGDDLVIFTLDGRIRAFKGASSTKTRKMSLWEYPPEDWEKYIGNPVLADLNKDGLADIVAAGVNHGIYVVDGKTGKALWKSNFEGNNPPITPPVVADLNNDSYLDLLIRRADKNLYQYTSNMRYPSGSVVWEQRFGSHQNNSQAVLFSFSASADNIQIILSLIVILLICGLHFFRMKKQKAIIKQG